MNSNVHLIFRRFIDQRFTPRQVSEALGLTLDDSIRAVREGQNAGCFILIDALLTPEHRERGGSLWWGNSAYPGDF